MKGRAESAGEAYADFQKRSYFAPLDGLRAVSILLVLLYHSPRLPHDSAIYLLRRLQENGRYGVGIFFLISGFLICTLLLREQSSTGRIALWKFYGRRALRLLPLYYALLLVQCFLIFRLHQYTAQNQELFREKLPSYLFYYSNWLPTMTQGPFFCAWSLAVEEQFYLVFGWLLFFCSRRLVALFICAALLLKIMVYQVFGAVDVGSRLCLILFSYREPILLGVLVGFVLNTERGVHVLKRLGSAWVAIPAGVLAALWLLLHRIRHESAWDAQLLYLLLTGLLCGLVVRPEVPLLRGRLLTHIGKVSYGIYLLHTFIFAAVNKFVRTPSFLPTNQQMPGR